MDTTKKKQTNKKNMFIYTQKVYLIIMCVQIQRHLITYVHLIHACYLHIFTIAFFAAYLYTSLSAMCNKNTRFYYTLCLLHIAGSGRQP